MKKIILAMACLLAVGSAAANAQNNTTCSPVNCNQVQCAPANCNQTPCGPNACVNPNGPGNCISDCTNACPFYDLNLTDAQKQKIQALNQNFETKKKAIKDQKKADKARNDSAKSSFRKQAMDLRSQKLSEIKNILTPEQYTKFLENYYLNGNNKGKNFQKGAPRHHSRFQGDGGPRHHKFDKKFDKKSDKKFDKKSDKKSGKKSK